MNARSARFVLGAAAAFLLAACGESDPWELRVTASTTVEFRMWQSRFASEFKPEDRARVETALQEIRLNIMGTREATGSDAIAEALRRKIHHRRLREVVQLGLEAKAYRLRNEAAALQVVMSQNAMLQTRPGDTASEAHLVGVHQKQAARLQAIEAEIRATEQDLEPYLKATGGPLIPAPVDKPDEMPVLQKGPKRTARR